MLPLDIDPKLAWALKFREQFPVDVNRAPRELLLRVPGLGVKAVDRIVPRGAGGAELDDVARLTVSVAKVRPFIVAERLAPDPAHRPRRPARAVAPKTEQLELFAA
jgi:predicted DNA-binding helix-hairpin-helix protein